MVVSEQGRDAAENVRRTLRNFTGDLTLLLEALSLDRLKPDAEGLYYWGNSGDSQAGRAATGGDRLEEDDLLMTVRTHEDRDCVVLMARVRAHELVTNRARVWNALPHDDRNRRWLRADAYLNDLIVVDPPLDVPAVDLDAVNAYLERPYRRRGNRFPSETIAVRKGKGEALVEALLGAASQNWPQLDRVNFDVRQQQSVQELAEATDPGELLPERNEDAYNDAVRPLRRHQARVQKKGFRIYGRRCSACADSREWRIEFAHLVPYGRLAIEDWFCGIPLCSNHHKDLDTYRLRLEMDLEWSAAPGVSLESLGVTAPMRENLGKGVHPTDKVLKAYWTLIPDAPAGPSE